MTPAYLLEEAYQIAKGAPIKPTAGHVQALYAQLHPTANQQSWCDYCYRLEEPDNLSVVDGQRFCGSCAKGKVE